MKGFARRLVLTQRQKATRIWPFSVLVSLAAPPSRNLSSPWNTWRMSELGFGDRMLGANFLSVESNFVHQKYDFKNCGITWVSIECKGCCLHSINCQTSVKNLPWRPWNTSQKGTAILQDPTKPVAPQITHHFRSVGTLENRTFSVLRSMGLSLLCHVTLLSTEKGVAWRVNQLLIKETGKEDAPFIFGANIYFDTALADENRPAF